MPTTYETLKREVRKLRDAGKIAPRPTPDQRADWAYGNTKIENRDVTRAMVKKAVKQKS